MSNLSLILLILGALPALVQVTKLAGIAKHGGSTSLFHGYVATALFIAAVLTR